MNVFLKPGELCISMVPAIVSTVLGSCVAVTIFNPRLKIGSICHAQLPRNPSSKETERFRYVDESINFMLRKMATLGINKNEMEVKLIGGAKVLGDSPTNSVSVGNKNIEIALEIIKNENLDLLVCDVGGVVGRKIQFFTHTGWVILKRLKKLPQDMRMSGLMREFNYEVEGIAK